jgi:hypothetical protein
MQLSLLDDGHMTLPRYLHLESMGVPHLVDSYGRVWFFNITDNPVIHWHHQATQGNERPK